MDWSSFSLGNAAGFIKGPGPQFDDMLRSAATDITIGSITQDERPGNSGNVYYLGEDGSSINALGLPNPGIAGMFEWVPDMAQRASKAGKRLRFSLAAELGQYRVLATLFSRYGKVEINLGCPNVWGDTGQKPIASFNLELIDTILNEVGFLPGGFDVKLSPYSDPLMIPKVASVLDRYDVSNVVVSNTFPNGLMFGDDTFRILDTPGGFGGIGGTTMHLIALGQVAQFATALEGTHIGVIGVGGVNSGKRFAAMHKAGAIGVQVGTAYGTHGAKIFSDILSEVE